MPLLHNLGYPKIGPKREWKKLLEHYWQKKINQQELLAQGAKLRENNWAVQSKLGLDYLAVGDFNYYDHVLNNSLTFGVVPDRVQKLCSDKVDLDVMFLMARGRSQGDLSTAACEMTKWFDTNYHYIVPEFSINQKFTLKYSEIFEHTKQCQALGYNPKPMLLGPLSFLWLGKTVGNQDKLDLLPDLLKCYQQLISELEKLNIEWLQLDEPILGLDIPPKWRQAFNSSYQNLKDRKLKIMLATYFGDVYANHDIISELPVEGVHIDATTNSKNLLIINSKLSASKVLSAGIVDGRNVWINDITASVDLLNSVYALRNENLWLAPSCSLLHCPVDLDLETFIDPQIKNWLAFSNQKLAELDLIKNCLVGPSSVDKDKLSKNKLILEDKQKSSRVFNQDVRNRVSNCKDKDFQRHSPFEERKQIQNERLQLPILPTTTIGSFPQTAEIRKLRLQNKKKTISDVEYETKMQAEIIANINKQHEIGLDVLVHGEPERNDMVEYFGEQLEGYVFSDYGWVVSYGSRCVKPPIIYGDISRPAPMTVKWSKFAAEQTSNIVKGMLTGPVTMLKWSFVRDDISNEDVCLQLAWALNDEVLDLEKAGLKVIQIDEPALREALPLNLKDQQHYLQWAVKSFRICCFGVSDQTQIHTHMCYCEFNEIMEAIANMDADVISIEAARSNFELLAGLKQYNYPNDIGPGVYDIHSPNVPEVEKIKSLVTKALQYVSVNRLWINPDCGLKTRSWTETMPSLKNMVLAAKQLRSEIK